MTQPEGYDMMTAMIKYFISRLALLVVFWTACFLLGMGVNCLIHDCIPQIDVAQVHDRPHTDTPRTKQSEIKQRNRKQDQIEQEKTEQRKIERGQAKDPKAGLAYQLPDGTIYVVPPISGSWGGTGVVMMTLPVTPGTGDVTIVTSTNGLAKNITTTKGKVAYGLW